jgi:hypothetical protein
MASEQTMIFKIQCTIHRMQGFFAPLREKISGQRSSEVILVESLTNRLCTKSPKDTTGLLRGVSRLLLFSGEREAPRRKAVASNLT